MISNGRILRCRFTGEEHPHQIQQTALKSSISAYSNYYTSLPLHLHKHKTKQTRSKTYSYKTEIKKGNPIEKIEAKMMTEGK